MTNFNDDTGDDDDWRLKCKLPVFCSSMRFKQKARYYCCTAEAGVFSTTVFCKWNLDINYLDILPETVFTRVLGGVDGWKKL